MDLYGSLCKPQRYCCQCNDQSTWLIARLSSSSTNPSEQFPKLWLVWVWPIMVVDGDRSPTSFFLCSLSFHILFVAITSEVIDDPSKPACCLTYQIIQQWLLFQFVANKKTHQRSLDLERQNPCLLKIDPDCHGNRSKAK